MPETEAVPTDSRNFRLVWGLLNAIPFIIVSIIVDDNYGWWMGTSIKFGACFVFCGISWAMLRHFWKTETRKGTLNLAVVILCLATLPWLLLTLRPECPFSYPDPITSTPTRKLDERLLGEWSSAKETMHVFKNKYDSGYQFFIAPTRGTFYSAYHSDVDGFPFVSVSVMGSNVPKYSYWTWVLSSDGQQLRLRPVNTAIIPTETRTPAAVQELLRKNLQNPDLFKGEEMRFTRRPH